jgi:hypothetical protein
MARRTAVPLAQTITERVLAMATVGEVRGYLTRKARQIWPNITLLDTRK